MYSTDTWSSPAPAAWVWPFCQLLLSIHLAVPLSDTQLLKGRDSPYSTLIPEVRLGTPQQHKPRSQERKRDENLPAVGISALSFNQPPWQPGSTRHSSKVGFKSLGPWAMDHPSQCFLATTGFHGRERTPFQMGSQAWQPPVLGKSIH